MTMEGQPITGEQIARVHSRIGDDCEIRRRGKRWLIGRPVVGGGLLVMGCGNTFAEAYARALADKRESRRFGSRKGKE